VDIEHSLDRVAALLGERPQPVTTRAGQPWVGLTPTRAVHIAYDDRTRNRIKEEAARLVWASEQGIPVPAVEDSTPDWLVTTRAVDHKATGGTDYVGAAVAAAHAISGAATAPPSVRGPVAAHGGGKKAGLERLYRILRSPLSPREFRDARAAAATLARDTLAHGDFVLHNVLFDRDQATVTVIDWEYLAYAPAQFDLMMLWPRLNAAEDRALVMDAALRQTTDRHALGTLHRWLAVRYLADLVTKHVPSNWPHERIRTAAERLREARTQAATWGA
jgi:aminoglycoside phosphotransferase